MSPRSVCAWSVVANLLLAAGAEAQPLAVFECREIVARDWSRTLVTYPN